MMTRRWAVAVVVAGAAGAVAGYYNSFEKGVDMQVAVTFWV
jgi:hypothetical protein